MRRIFLGFGAIYACLAQQGSAIVIRDDVPAASYENAASRIPGYCQLDAPDGGGVLIAPTWVLTAAHLAGDLHIGHHFQCGHERETIASIVVNPKFNANIGRHDLALIKLTSRSSMPAIPLMKTKLKAGRIVNLIGHYQGGTGTTGGVGRNPTGLRAATNRVSSVDNNWIRFVFDAPSAAATTPLEGVSGAGDSGAPAYLTKGGQTFVVGIGSRSSDTNRDGVEQDYGDTDLYVPVASHRAWIERITGAKVQWRSLF